MYAIVDIETTGGYAAAGGITEIAIIIYDGKRVIKKYETLLNPLFSIPRYVESLTGITNGMVEYERTFDMVADEIFELLNDKIFVAHNVNFDYSFLKHHLGVAGYDLNCKKLCTIRMGRQIIPGLPSYSLGNLCRSIGIDVENRHRAGGDAEATVKLFELLLQKDTKDIITSMLKGRSKEQYLPPNLPAQQVKELPHTPGVYYFHDQKGKVIYVGKAKSLSKRITSHFSNNKAGKQKQEFLRKIHTITWNTTGTELMAFILESVEIKKFWPDQNRSQKRFQQSYGLYSFLDMNGYMRLAIEKKRNNIEPLYSFNLLVEGHNLLRKLCNDFTLSPELCFLQRTGEPCKETAVDYNIRVAECIAFLNKELPSFALVGEGLTEEEKSCILMEKGKFYGMGYIPGDVSVNSIDEIKSYITAYGENDYIRGLVYQHAERYPANRVSL